MKENHLHIQDSGFNHNDFNSIISFHKIKALFSSRALVKPGAMDKCEGRIPVQMLSPQQRILHSLLMSSQIFFCAAAVNSSCWASNATDFTCTLSDTVEALWELENVFSLMEQKFSAVILLQVASLHQFLLKRYLFQPQQGYWKCNISECDLQLHAVSASSVSAKENEISAG